MFYIVEKEFVGRIESWEDYPHTVLITDIICKDFEGHEIINGSVSEICGWAVRTYGEYETIESAKLALLEKFQNSENFEEIKTDYVLEYRINLQSLDKNATKDWLEDGMMQFLNKKTTEEEIKRLIEEFEEEASSQGLRLSNVYEIIQDFLGNL